MIINRYAKGGGLSPRIVVTATTGSTVTCTKGSTTLTATEVDGKWTFNLNDFGTWTLNATLGDKSATKTVDVVWAQLYEVTLLFVDATLDNNDWETIKQVADASAGESYWAVGDTKQITINGKLSDGLTLSNYSTYVYIIGFDHNKDVEGTGIAFGSFKSAAGNDMALCDSNYNTNATSGQWFNMNNTNANNGGWESSLMRTATIPVVKEALPSDLLDVIKTTVIYTDNVGGSSTAASRVTSTKDDVYLLSEFEVYGVQKWANSAEQNYQQQYAYYAAGNSKVKYRHNTSPLSSAYWWERSVRTSGSTAFCRVDTGGSEGSDSALICYGLSIVFKVGTTPIFPTLNDNSWSAIAKVAYEGAGENYWSVGDTKSVLLNGTAGSRSFNKTLYVYIVSFDHNKDVEGTGILFQGFKTAQTGGIDVAIVGSQYQDTTGFRMNGSFTSVGGWNGSAAYITYVGQILGIFPSSLTSVIKASTIYTDNTGGGSDTASYVTTNSNFVYYPSEFEIFGTRTYANSAEQNYQQQYAYYAAGNSKVKYRDRSTSNTAIWECRSPGASGLDGQFCAVGVSGQASMIDADTTYAVAPVFRVCYTPPQPVSELAVGTIVKVKESGTDVDYIIVHQGNPDTSIYDSSCDGTWLLRKDIYANGQYNSNNIASYPNSTIDTSLNSGFLNSLSIKDTIKQIKIPYAISNYSSSIKVGAEGYLTKVFPLSLPELGFRTSDYSGVVADGAKLSYFEYGTDSSAKNLRISNNQGWWTRDPVPNEYSGVSYIDGYGGRSGVTAESSGYGYRPAFIIPSDTIVSDGIVGGGSNVSV